MLQNIQKWSRETSKLSLQVLLGTTQPSGTTGMTEKQSFPTTNQQTHE